MSSSSSSVVGARFRVIGSWLSLSLLTGGTAGCQHFDRARECRALSRLVNPVLHSIDVERQDGAATAKTYRAIEKQYFALAGAITELRPQNLRVQDASADYTKLAREAGHDARLFADALDSKDETRMTSARASAARTAKHESTALARLDAACRNPR